MGRYEGAGVKQRDYFVSHDESDAMSLNAYVPTQAFLQLSSLFQ